MALTIEDGTGVANADSYVTVAECEAFAIAYFGASLNGNASHKEAALRRAALFINSLPFKGTRTFARDQGLAWPRKDATDGEETDIPEEEIPQEVKDAQCILARVEFQSPGLLAPTVTLSDKKTLIEVGGIKFQPRASPNTIEAARPVVTQAIDLLQGFLLTNKPKFLLRA